ncbi:MAG: hypothetical protein J5791_05600 [Fibrobacter sp.]|nr:hypothetical protein [Fibrobacter sp.]
MFFRIRSLLAIILIVSLLSGCGLSDDTQEQLEEAVGKAAGEALDSARSKTATAVEEISTTIDEHGGVQGIFDKIVQFIDGIFGGSGSGCEEKTAQKVERDTPRTVIKRNAEQQNYHEEVLSLTILKAASVNIDCLRPEVDTAINIVTSVYHEVFKDDNYRPVITSGNDSDKHGERSAHYACAAVDIRIKDVENQNTRRDLAQKIRDELGSRYTVLHEDIGMANEHLHVQLRSGTYDRNVVWK